MKQTNLEWLTEKGKAASGIATTKFTELMVGGEDAVENAYIEYLKWLASPRIEPITLTAAERKAVQLLIDCGYSFVIKSKYGSVSISCEENMMLNCSLNCVPNAMILGDATWIKEEYIDLRTLLKEKT